MKVNSGQAPSTLIPEYIGSDFDAVLSCADNIADLKTIVGSLDDVVVVADNIGDVNAVAPHIDDVDVVANNIDYVKDVADGIAGLPVVSYIGSTPPLNPTAGAEWYCTTDGRTYVWYVDTDSSQWIESSPQSVVTPWLAESGVSLKNKFGAADNTDITANLTSAINWSKANGYIPVVIDVVGASITGPLPQLNNSFEFVPLYGRGSKITQIDITAAGDDVFKWIGGSGGLAGIVMKGLSIVGTESQEPLLNKGMGGARFYDCRIEAKTACKLSTDIGSGTFTEFVVFDSCLLHVKRVFTMQRGAGDGSFHGCGLTNRTIVEEMAGNDGPLFVVGMPGDTQRCVWYNAPLDGQVFKNSTYPIIGNGRTGVNDVVLTIGNLTFENFTATPVTIGNLPPNVKHIHCGNILGWNLKYVLGSCVLASAASILPNGAIYGVAKPYVINGSTSTTSINTGIFEGAGIGRLVNIRVTGNNYDYQILVHFAGRISQYIPPVAKIIDTLVAFNSAGWGPPVVSVNEYELVISNPAWTGNISWKASVGAAAI